MIIDCISDLHGYYPELEGGDLLIVSGDLTARDTEINHLSFETWLYKQNYKKKIIVSGNHDNRYTPDHPNSLCEYWKRFDDTIYLCDSGTEFEGLKIWGSPWTKTFPGMNPHCKAFTCDTEEELFKKFQLITHDTDILITHSPAFGILDRVKETQHLIGESVGSLSLNTIILSRYRMPNLKLHVFGHIHEMGGQLFETNFTKFVNASYVNENYEPVNKPIRVIL